MASNIGTLATFVGSNMKPSPGEQGDALWAQQVADNGGAVYYRHMPLNAASGIFLKTPAHNALKGIVQGVSPGGVTADVMRVYAQGQPLGAALANTLVGTMTYTRVIGSLHQYNFDISTLTNGSYYVAWYDPGLGGVALAAQTLYLTWGTAAP